MQFETEKDLEKEERVLTLFCKYMNCESSKLPKWDVDSLLSRDGKAIGFAEIKNYNYTSFKYPYGILSINKLHKLVECSRFLPTVLIVNHTDKLGYIKLDEISGDILYGGRNPREGAKNDMEWVIKFIQDKIVWIFDNVRNEFYQR